LLAARAPHNAEMKLVADSDVPTRFHRGFVLLSNRFAAFRFAFDRPAQRIPFGKFSL
jgi:hypothetical protein